MKIVTRTLLVFMAILAVGLSTASASAQHAFAHTHIGINPTWRPDWSDPGNPDLATDPDSSDDNQLWFFSVPPIHPVAPTPNWPYWGSVDDPFLRVIQETSPTGDPIQKPGDPTKSLYTCRFTWSKENGYDDPAGYQHLDGWHSADGPQGVWNLAGGDAANEPDWDIYLQRESTSLPEDDFFMLLPDDTPILTADDSTYQLGKEWSTDEQIWEIHSHMSFNFWLSDEQVGELVTATLSAYDAGGMYSAADRYTFVFQVIPEPTTLALLTIGLLVVGRRTHSRLGTKPPCGSK